MNAAPLLKKKNRCRFKSLIIIRNQWRSPWHLGFASLRMIISCIKIKQNFSLRLIIGFNLFD